MHTLISQIHRILAEQDSRSRSPLATYNKTTIHAKQMEFHKCLLRNRWVFGGNRTGKTECGAVETVWLALGIHPYRANKPNVSCWVVSLSKQVQRDVAQQKILHYLPRRCITKVVMASGGADSPECGVIDYLLVKNAFGGTSKIAFKSCEAGREKFQGTSLDFVWFDEEPPWDVYRECQMRVLDRRGHLFGTMTPLKGLSWVYDEIYLNAKNDPQVWCTFMQWTDNPFLPQDEAAALAASLSDDELTARCYGRFQPSYGLVYPEFSPKNVIQPFSVPQNWQDCLSIDPGLSNPLSCHWYARDGDDNIFVVAEHYEAGKDVAYHAAKIKEISEGLGWKTDRFGRYAALMDSAANQRTLAAGKSVAELFAEHGLTVNTKVNKDVYSGINRVKAALKPSQGTPKLYIFANCTNMIREIKGYAWGTDDRPVKRDDHAMDELRYYVAHVAQSACPLTARQKHKQGLQRAAHRSATNFPH